jgi:outer membrane lipoprotein-sorting protein
MKLKKNIILIVLITLVIFINPMVAQEKQNPSPFEILDQIDKNMIYKTAYVEMDMVIQIKNRKITKSLISYSEGNEKSFIEFLSPARDKGTKMLRKDNIIKIYYPSAERIMRLSGHMLRQSMMGSDFSYEDMTERTRKLREEYEAKMLEPEILDDTECYVMELTSKKKKQTYFKRKIWVDKKKYVGLKEELYSKGGKLLKTSKVNRIEIINKRHYPTIMTMEDKLRKNSSTVMVLTKIEFDLKLPEGIFTDRNLQKQ